MIGANKKTDVWGCTTYRVPVPYLRTREEGKKDADESKGRRFVQSPGDGAAYKFGKGNRGRFYHINSYGKEGKEPPHSYLPYKELGVKKVPGKKEEKGEKKGPPGRGSFIDDIFFYGNKFKYPGPEKYFSASDAKDKKKEPKPEDKDKKKTERLNFLCDAEYLGMNNPDPGTYPLKAISQRENLS